VPDMDILMATGAYRIGRVLCCVAQRELRQLCRRGFPTQYRADVWKRLIYAKVADVRSDKVDHYYRHLVMRSRDSPVRRSFLPRIITVITADILVVFCFKFTQKSEI